MTTEVVRVNSELLGMAKAVGATMGRSATGQLSYWARLGRAVELSGVPSSAIPAVLNRQAEFDSLNAEDQAAVRVLWEQKMSERIANIDLVAEFEASGQAYAELDDNGNVVEVLARQPAAPAKPEAVGVPTRQRARQKSVRNERGAVGKKVVAEGPRTAKTTTAR